MIEVRINGYECEPSEIEVGTAGSYGVQELHLSFSGEWEGLSKRTTWMTDAGNIVALPDERDMVTVPAEATATAGRRWMSIDGVAAGKQRISVRVAYKVYETVAPGGANSVTPTDSEMEQALAILEEVKALKTPEITVGKTETVEAGTPARVKNTGTATKAVLDFEIPRGESGVYVGADEPDETVKVWVDPEGENDAEGAVIDLNAAVQEAQEAAEEAGRVVEGAADEAARIAAQAVVEETRGELESYVSAAQTAERGAADEREGAEAARAASEAAESGAIAAKTAAEAAVLNGPKIENDTWWVYDAAKQTYVDTGVDASGVAGQTGERGTGLLKVSTAPSSYTTAIGDYAPKYRIALDTVIAESGADKVLVGDVIEQLYYHYVVDYLDDTYAYSSVTRTSIRGATGATGARGVGVRDVLPVAESSESGGTNTFRVRLTDGNYTDFNYRNGKDGGYYTPTVSQPDANTMRVSYTPSQEGMAGVEQVDVALPQGPKGDTGLPAGGSAGDVLTKTESGTEWKAPSGGNNATKEEVSEAVSVGSESVTLDSTAPTQTINLAWNVPPITNIPAFTNQYIAREDKGLSYPRAFNTSGYVQTWGSAGHHCNAETHVAEHSYFCAMEYEMDGESTAKLLNWGGSIPQDGSVISGSGWVYGVRTLPSSGAVGFALDATNTGTGTIKHLYCIDVTALLEAGTISSILINDLVALFGGLELIPGQNYAGSVSSGTATLTINRNGETVTVDNSASTAIVQGNDVLTVEGGSVTFLLKVIREVSGDRVWAGKKWVAFGDSLTDETINADKKYYRYIEEKTGITVVVMGKGGTGYYKTYDSGTAYGQRMANIPADADVVTIFGSVNDWHTKSANVAMGNASDTMDAGTLAGYINECIDVAIEKAPYAQIALVTPMDYHGLPDDVLESIANIIKAVAEYRKIKCLDLYHESGFRVDNPTFAAVYTTDYSETAESFGHPSNLAHEQLIAPEFMELLKRMLLTA